MNPAIKKCLIAAGAKPVLTGGRDKMARDLGVTKQALHQFITQGWLPERRAAQAAKLYGVPVEQLLKPKAVTAIAES